jgi:cell division protein FtsL
MTALKSNKSRKKNYALISWKKINLILIVCLIIMGAVNLVIVNDMTAKSFEIRDLRREISLVSEESRKLENNLMALKSYDNIKNRIDELHLVSAQNIRHINTQETNMARR